MPFEVNTKPTTAIVPRRLFASQQVENLVGIGCNHRLAYYQLTPQFTFSDMFLPLYLQRMATLLVGIEDKAGRDLVAKAFYLAWVGHEKIFRDSGEIYFEHPLAVAEWAARIGLNAEEIATALCHDLVEDKCVTAEYLQEKLGKTVADLVDGVTKLGKEQGYSGEEPSLAARLQKRLKAGIQAIIIGLGDRLHNMQTLQHKLSDGENGETDQEKRRMIAQETMSVYVPLANRFGLWEVKRELEDLAFQYLEPELFAQIKMKSQDLQAASRITVNDIEGALQYGILTDAEVVSESRGVYELYQRMQQHHISLADLSPSDIWRLNINVIKSEANLVCYETLKELDQIYRPAKPEEHRRYLGRNARPNGHEFIHHWIEVPDFGLLLTQIRDAEMWERNRRGILTDPNWRELKWAELEALVSLLGEEGVSEQAAYEMVGDLGETIKVETPIGEKKEIPAGATVLDFAFLIHSKQALKTSRARVNGKPADLSQVLRPDDRVQIIWARSEEAPIKATHQWLEWVHTALARTALRGHLSKRRRDENLLDGLAALNKALEPYFVPVNRMLETGLMIKYLSQLGAYQERSQPGRPQQKLYVHDPDRLLVEIGAGERPVRQVVAKLLETFRQEKSDNLQSKGWQETPYFICFRAEDKPGIKNRYASDFSRMNFNISYESQLPLGEGAALIILGVDIFGGTERKRWGHGVERGRGGMVGQVQRIQVETIAAKHALPESINQPTGRVIILTEPEAAAYLKVQTDLTASLAAKFLS